MFEPAAVREVLIADLRRLWAPADVVAAVAGAGVDIDALGTAEAVPFWNRALGSTAVDDAVAGLALSDAAFDLAAEAYLDQWRTEIEHGELFHAARRLARAAQDRLSASGADGL